MEDSVHTYCQYRIVSIIMEGLTRKYGARSGGFPSNSLSSLIEGITPFGHSSCPALSYSLQGLVWVVDSDTIISFSELPLRVLTLCCVTPQPRSTSPNMGFWSPNMLCAQTSELRQCVKRAIFFFFLPRQQSCQTLKGLEELWEADW